MAIRPGILTTVVDRVDSIVNSIEALAKNQVLVGVPQEKAPREQGSEEPINNAALAYIHNFGSPEQNIPARPHTIPAVRSKHEDTVRMFRQTAQDAMDRGPSHILRSFAAIGQMNVNAIKSMIQAGLQPPLKPATIAARKRAHKSRRGGNERPLIDTAQYINAQNFVIRSR